MVSTAPIRRATQQYQQFFPQATAAEQAAVNQATGTLTGQAIPALQGAEQQAVGTLQGALPQGISYLQQGYGQAGQDINKALGLYSPLAQTANQAYNLYGQALMGGPQAQQAFEDYWKSTGAQAELEKGTTGLERMANARGMLASGNLTQDEIDYMTNAVRGGYQGWLGDLWNQGSLAPGIAGEQSGLYQTLANQGIGLGQQEAGLTQGTAQDVAGLQSGLGRNLSNIYSGIAGMQQGLGQDTAQNILGAGQVGYQGAQDIFNVRAQKEANDRAFWANMIKAGATVGGDILGGPIGGQIGSSLASAFAPSPGVQVTPNFG